jgi:hypothetical protein
MLYSVSLCLAAFSGSTLEFGRRSKFDVLSYNRTEPFSDEKQSKLPIVSYMKVSGSARAVSPYRDYFQTRLLEIIARFARTLPLHSKFFAFDP